MTLAEFEAAKDALPCQRCGVVGLALECNANNGGVRPVCPHCGYKTPLPGVQWLRQQQTKTPQRRGHDVREVWSACGDHCGFCGKSWALCERLGIGRSVQHVMPFYKGGDEWPVIPFCARCQQASTASLEETRRIEAAVLGQEGSGA